MELEHWITWAYEQKASDLHLEAGLPATVRVRGELRALGEKVQAPLLTSLARELLDQDQWSQFLHQGSADLARTMAGVRCRINILRSARGVGLAVRLLSAPVATLKLLNLHPSLSRLVQSSHGLVLISGPTGSGKTSTVAALLQEINLNEARHIITLESPIEYAITPRVSLVRQREVGRDTPSFAQGLYDAMREDPDVLMVGEMREPEVMRSTLNAAETGHLVLATMHSASVAEALQRIVAAFPAEVQAGICGQLGDSLVGALAQRLVYREDLAMRVPECEVLMASTGARSLIRQGQFFKLPTVIESGAADGCWSLARYRAWLEAKQDWMRSPDKANEESEPAAAAMPGPNIPRFVTPMTRPTPVPDERSKPLPPVVPAPGVSPHDDAPVLILDDADDDLSSVLQAAEQRKPRKR